MSSTMSHRIATAFYITIAIFMINSILNKLLFLMDDWLFCSLMQSTSWGLGYYIRTEFNYKYSDTDFSYYLENVILKKASIILSVFIILTFSLGVVFNYSNWWEIEVHIIVPFAISVFLESSY